MRWSRQAASSASSPAAELPGLDLTSLQAAGSADAIRLAGLVQSVRPLDFDGITFHEVLARSVLNQVPGDSSVPFRWTINPYRGCSHACVYCFARNTHSYLDLDTGVDFDRQIVVKVNLVEVLSRELLRSSWRREPVALGTNTDPYQRAEGRYRLMPGIIDALTRSGTPFSILTKGTLARRDLGQLSEAAQQVGVGFGVSIALADEKLHHLLEPGAPSPRARLQLVRAITAAGLPCQVLVAPVIPLLTDSDEALDEILGQVAAAGATSATVFALHLRPGAREWFLQWLARLHPHLVEPYARLYAGGSYVVSSYAADLSRRTSVLLRRHGLDGSQVLRGPAHWNLRRDGQGGPQSSP